MIAHLMVTRVGEGAFLSARHAEDKQDAIIAPVTRSIIVTKPKLSGNADVTI